MLREFCNWMKQLKIVAIFAPREDKVISWWGWWMILKQSWKRAILKNWITTRSQSQRISSWWGRRQDIPASGWYCPIKYGATKSDNVTLNPNPAALPQISWCWGVKLFGLSCFFVHQITWLNRMKMPKSSVPKCILNACILSPIRTMMAAQLDLSAGQGASPEVGSEHKNTKKHKQHTTTKSKNWMMQGPPPLQEKASCCAPTIKNLLKLKQCIFSGLHIPNGKWSLECRSFLSGASPSKTCLLVPLCTKRAQAVAIFPTLEIIRWQCTSNMARKGHYSLWGNKQTIIMTLPSLGLEIFHDRHERWACNFVAEVLIFSRRQCVSL